MNDPAGMIAKKADCPDYDQYDSDDIKQISHDC